MPHTHHISRHQFTGDLVQRVPADRGPGYQADLDEVLARTADAWSAGYATGYHDGRADRAADAAHRALATDLRSIADGPEITSMNGSDAELRARAAERERAGIARARVGRAS
ncbi:hypothetical protein [Mobilicoccus massiliensis]|uniref:hypothetical protein n=1 Tax=Mobilicoccus massiliensis TaxID=1522310 RepID=UPI00058D7245|nr:hypothetical protein [Mobilicoccus massiliensis]